MLKLPKTESDSTLNPTCRMAFAVAVCAFLSAGVFIVVNQWVACWLAVGGMVGIGCFYTVIGLQHLKISISLIDHDLTTASARHARAENLLGEAIIRDHVDHTADRTHLLIRKPGTSRDPRSEPNPPLD